MAYDPADLQLPPWLLALLDALVRIRVPLAPSWQLGFTRPGLLFFAVILGVWAAALYSGNNLLYLCGGMLLVMAATAVIYGMRLLLALPALAEYLPATVIASEVFVGRRRLTLARPQSGVVWVYGCNDGEAALRSESGHATFSMRLPPLLRGVYASRHIRLITEAPLGLWRLQWQRPISWQLAVLPRPVPWLGAGKAQGLAMLGWLPGDEWRDLRPYVRGDQPSRIHWRKAACGDWTVKRFAEPEGRGEADLLRVDLRAVPGAEFERLLGMAHAWMLAHPRACLILGQERFDLADPAQCRAAQFALATAAPETRPPAGSGGVVLSLVHWRHAA